jgi:chemotaxis family two-component system sensor kinase Cph1
MSVTQDQLTSCDREPIHVPGSIQPHGFLVVLNKNHLTVQAASETAAAYLGRPLSQVIGCSAGELFDADFLQLFEQRMAIVKETFQARWLFSMRLPVATSPDEFEVIAHRTNEAIVLEFERTAGSFDSQLLDAELYKIIADTQTLGSADEICGLAVREIRRITGFDRTLMYRFDADGHGTTIAEVTNERLPSYLHLRFPASDIPVQARRLYVMNRIRIIPDVNYTPSIIVSDQTSEDLRAPIDLSGSVLRSVSPVHREYMRNMGTYSSMSISVVINNQLWGLISCHHASPKFVPFRLRSACEFLVQIFSTQLAAQLRAAELSKMIHLKSVQQRLLTHMAAEDSYIDGLARYPEDLLELTEASGAAIVVGDICRLLGNTPSTDQVLSLAAFFEKRGHDDSFSTDQLATLFPEAENWNASASGVLAIFISKIHRTVVMWFRPELVKTVKWAGNPTKSIDTKGDNKIEPRHSFAEWSESVRGRSAPWSPEVIAAAGELRMAILEVVLKQAEEMADMANNLRSANQELEAFSYSVSHDLRAPFRHITGFSQLLLELEGDQLSATGKRYVTTIVDSAKFAGQLVDSLLNFSRIARSSMTLMPVDLYSVFNEQWQDLMSVEGAGRSIVFELGQLPVVRGDLTLLRQVARNLLSNAVKYTRNRPIAHVNVSSVVKGLEHVISVSDDGAGFDQAYEGKLFGVFQRLHRSEDFEGTGIGLANVRRIVSRHGGRTWARGELGRGATFFFTLPATVVATTEANALADETP